MKKGGEQKVFFICAKITDVHFSEEKTMRVFIFFLTAAALLIAVGCSRSAIKIDGNNQLIISNNQTTIEVKSALLESRKINLGSLYVDQNIIAADDTRCIVYEEIRTAAGYRFNYGYKRSIDLIFNAYRVEEGKRYGNLGLYRVTLRDENKSVVNLLALRASKKSLKLVYGFSDKEFRALGESLDQNSRVFMDELSASTERRDNCIQSSWQPKLLIMDSLVGKEGGKISRGALW